MSTTLAFGPSRRIVAAICTFGLREISVRFEFPDFPVIQINLFRSDALLVDLFKDIVYPTMTENTYRRIQIYQNQRHKLLARLVNYEFSYEDIDALFARVDEHVAQWVKEGDLV